MVDIRKPGAGRSIELFQADDFQGGLNLKADWFRLEENQSPDMLNVDIHRSGGIRQRDGLTTFIDPAGGWDGGAATGTYGADAGGTYGGVVEGGGYGGNGSGGGAISYIKQFWTLYQESGVSNLLFNASDDVIYDYVSGVYSTVGNADNTNGYLNAITYGDVNWIVQWAEAVSKTWDGITLTALSDPSTTAWQPTFGTPGPPFGTHMPRARYIATNNEHAFVAYTSENGTDYPNRVRFSHPGDPGKWREDDFFYIGDAASGEAITGIASVADHIIVFKRKSAYIIVGHGEASFQVIKISDRVGNVCQRTMALGDGRVWFFDPHNGLHVYTPNSFSSDQGAGVQWLFDPLHPITQDGSINDSVLQDELFLGYLDTRVWISIPLASGADNDTYVFDTRTGAWTKYDTYVGPFIEFDDDGFSFLGSNRKHGIHKIMNVGDTGSEFDDFGDVEFSISAHYITAWYDLNTPTLVKNWRRPEFVINYKGETDIELRVDVYRDFSDVVRKQLAITDTATPGTLWDSGIWDTSTWEAGSVFDNVTFVERAGGLGKAKGVALKIYVDPAIGQKLSWNIPHITFKYKQRPIRG